MANTQLSELDRASHIEQLRRSSQEGINTDMKILFLMGLGFSPFLAMTFMFIPVLGQLLVGTGLIVTLYYFRLRRSWMLFLSWSLGALIAFGLTILAAHTLRGRLDVALFFLLALGLPLSICYLVVAGAMIWRFVNK